VVKNRNNIAIIGNGCAAAECIKALRESGYSGEIHVFTDSKWPVYNPMLTTYYAAGKIGFSQLFPYGPSDEFYREYRAEVHPGSPVICLDAEKRIVVNQAGFEINYTQCLIASGASPFLPPIKGFGSDKVYVMRTIEDALRLKDALDMRPRRALVVGASLIGIKLVELFYSAGVSVSLADMAEHLFPLNAHPECARVIEDRLRNYSIKLRFGAGITKVENVSDYIRAYFGNESEEADLLVMCTGTQPNTGFLNHRQVDVEQGVIVDHRMMTSVTGLYAAGDVSRGKNPLTGEWQTSGLWSNARYQGRTAGRNMAGIRETFPGVIPHNIAHFLGMDFVSIGNICQYDIMEKQSDGKEFRQLFWKDGLLTGANFVDTYTEAGVIKNALIKGLTSDKTGYANLLAGVQNLLIRNILVEIGGA
jgi:NADPH-dependent 2,4-dienoyl-CoA reductase/sulfur reductase-like enzyme